MEITDMNNSVPVKFRWQVLETEGNLGQFDIIPAINTVIQTAAYIPQQPLDIEAGIESY